MSNYRCGYCFQDGHNKTTCPKMKQDYEVASKAVEEGTSTRHLTYRLRRALREYPEVQRNKKRVRRCSYCDGEGHRITTCPTRKEHIQQYKDLSTIWQRRVTEVLQKHGVGPGAIIMQQGWRTVNNAYERTLDPHIITEIDPFDLGIADFLKWSRHSENAHRLIARPLSDPTRNKTLRVPYVVLYELSEMLASELGDRTMVNCFRHPDTFDGDGSVVSRSTAKVEASPLLPEQEKLIFKGDKISTGHRVSGVYGMVKKNNDGVFFGVKL